MLRPATESDLDHMLRWRNHPRVREVSLQPHEIALDEHHRWWRSVSANPARRVLIYELDGVPSGVVQFSIDGREAEWGFHLDIDGLDERDETLPAWWGVQREAVEYAFKALDVDLLSGEVLEHNIAVRRMNARLGFVEGSPRRVVIDGTSVLSYPITLRREDAN